MKPSVDDIAKLKACLREVATTYSDSPADRKMIHEREWKAGRTSILLDAEIVSDAFAGPATSWIHEGSVSLDVSKSALLDSARENSETLEYWIDEHGAEFPSFRNHLRAVLDLRSLVDALLPG
jgi:hypothetical protein